MAGEHLKRQVLIGELKAELINVLTPMVTEHQVRCRSFGASLISRKSNSFESTNMRLFPIRQEEKK